MSKPYIDTYENENGHIVLVYVKEITIGESVEPDFITIEPDHVDEILKSILETRNYIRS